MQGGKQVGQYHKAVELAEHWRHQVTLDRVEIRAEAGLHRPCERATAWHREELHPGRLRTRWGHQEASRLEENQPYLIAHSTQSLGVKLVPTRGQSVVRPDPSGQTTHEAQKRPWYVSPRQRFQTTQSGLGPGCEVLTNQWQVEKPLTGIIQDFEAAALRTDGCQKPLAWNVDIKRQQRYRGCPCWPARRVSRKCVRVRFDFESRDVGCFGGRYGHGQSPPSQPINHCRQRRSAC